MKAACLIPCYNESKRLDLAQFRHVAQHYPNLDLYFLNDGSSDETLQVLNAFSIDFSNVFVFDYGENQGKAEVIRASMMQLLDSEYEHIGFLDADLATPLEEFIRILDIAQNNYYDITMGSRVKLKGWDIQRNALRHWFSRIVLTLVDGLFKLEIYDTQCGCKIFRRSILHVTFSKPFVTKWLFDIEVFVRYMRAFPKTEIMEVPLKQWKEVKGSKIKWTDFLAVPFNILQLYLHYGRNKIAK
jgi:glycosyltransferase involved in cell wall biosynthesis